MIKPLLVAVAGYLQPLGTLAVSLDGYLGGAIIVTPQPPSGGGGSSIGYKGRALDRNDERSKIAKQSMLLLLLAES